MRRLLTVIITLLLAGTFDIQAQVTIGADQKPHDGAVLDIVSDGKKGLLLPRVLLTSVTDWRPLNGTSVDGMLIYNTNTSSDNNLSGKGIYIWFNNRWYILNDKRHQNINRSSTIAYKESSGNNSSIVAIID
ncbi:hypothetical protein M2451_000850 [Dysgonomonas sp. PFB1-18]|uniref:hypothetical protein n=1 Tax=unclassified Dysgonomonas TaxID=2630389 RepID=UPI0024740900|nr:MULTISPECIES: hypothetical protein [unclassified Dysgonomonas]MDH6308539.1 hypothetical protein [Dysgonomonas sp. PF1-14]MDH6338040.1 hypothetical protein [Dysgonomonas sp. PF1-16]MDH6379537.1 hypothetical protein [Dysgonomonas sp. PFB1-18]MDH6396867.1 hypothetical protein [Dysgonomonas sp. PF1-23]